MNEKAFITLEENYYVVILSTEKDEEALKEISEGSMFMVDFWDLMYDELVDFGEYKVLSSKYFIEIQACNLVFDYQLYKYTCIETWKAREIYAKVHCINLSPLVMLQTEYNEISIKLLPAFFNLMPKAYYFFAFLRSHHNITKKKI